MADSRDLPAKRNPLLMPEHAPKCKCNQPRVWVAILTRRNANSYQTKYLLSAVVLDRLISRQRAQPLLPPQRQSFQQRSTTPISAHHSQRTLYLRSSSQHQRLTS